MPVIKSPSVASMPFDDEGPPENVSTDDNASSVSNSTKSSSSSGESGGGGPAADGGKSMNAPNSPDKGEDTLEGQKLWCHEQTPYALRTRAAAIAFHKQH